MEAGITLLYQLLNGLQSERLQHRLGFSTVGANMAADEIIALFELHERCGKTGVVHLHGVDGISMMIAQAISLS